MDPGFLVRFGIAHVIRALVVLIINFMRVTMDLYTVMKCGKREIIKKQTNEKYHDSRHEYYASTGCLL